MTLLLAKAYSLGWTICQMIADSFDSDQGFVPSNPYGEPTSKWKGLIMKRALAPLVLLMVHTLSSAAFANSSLQVELWDNGETFDLSKNMGMAIGSAADMSKAPMGIKIQSTVVPAGKVTFKATNTSKSVIHEMMVAPIAKSDAVLPFIAAENRADEETTHDLGMVEFLDPGKTGELTVDMKPGIYVLYCNVPGHLAAGMWTTITVK